MDIGTRVARQVAQGIAKRGKMIVLRTPTVTVTGSNQTINPPLLENPTVATETQETDTTISLVATMAAGQIFAGDTIIVAGNVLQVSAIANATMPPFTGGAVPGFLNIPLAAPIGAVIPQGTPVSMCWQADLKLKAIVQSFSMNMVDGDLIQAEDLKVTLPAYNTPLVTSKNRLVIDTDVRAVVSVQKVYAGSCLVRQDVQAR